MWASRIKTPFWGLSSSLPLLFLLKYPLMDTVSFAEFKKLDLRVGKILSADPLEGSDKLLKLTVALGDEERTIVAGIAQEYASDQLVGREVVILTNLEPKIIKGVESEGMLLAADVEGRAVLLFPDKDVPEGSIVR